MNNTQRITVSLPKHLHDQLVVAASSRGVSKFVAKAVEERLLEDDEKDPVDEFVALRKRMPKVSRTKILKAIEEGRQ